MPRLDGIGPVLTLIDAAAVLLAALVAHEAAGPALIATVVAVAVARAADLHRPRLVLSVLEDLPGLFVAALAATVVVLGAGGASVGFAPIAFAGLVLGHAAGYAGTRALRMSGRVGRRVIVVGTGPTGRRLATSLQARPALGLEPVGCVATGQIAGPEVARGLPVPLLGAVPSLPRAMSDARVHAVVLALPAPATEAEAAAVEGLLVSDAEIYAVPEHLPRLPAHTRQARELIDGVPLVHLCPRGTPLPVRLVKRATGVVVALLTLLALAVPVGVLALLTLAETRGVLVGERRDDEWGRSVTVPRFRTRHVRSMARPGTTFVIAISGRVGPVGRLLRRTRLDVLPEVVWAQLHVLRHAGGAAGPVQAGSAAATLADQSQVDAGQLAR